MPRIIVLAECRYAPRGRVVLEERVVTVHFESDHTSAQLVERVGWAIVDADELERADTGTPMHPSAVGDQKLARTDERTGDRAA